MDESLVVEGTCVVIEQLLLEIKMFVIFMTYLYLKKHGRRNIASSSGRTYSFKHKVTRQLEHMHFVTSFSDETSRFQLRMSMDCFRRLCYLLENIGGLSSTRNCLVSEQVAMFLTVLSHHTKNSIVKGSFKRSGYTVSKHFNRVLMTLLKLHHLILVNPDPVSDDCTDTCWKWFKGCLGALDGSYIPVRVSATEMPRYRNRKGNLSVNVLAVCNRNMNYIYVLTGWEGSAADSMVLRNAIARPNGLKIPNGNYYLVYGGYTNGPGFLAPYRGVRYHIKEWDAAPNGPANGRELYNIRHSRARNVIERSFGILMGRWGILCSSSWYPIKTHNQIILACCLLHNFIRANMDVDPMEAEIPDLFEEEDRLPDYYIDHVESLPAWTDWRDELAGAMWDDRTNR